MIAIKKKDWIEVVLHIAFWVGVFYTLMSLTESHIKMRINYKGAIIKNDNVVMLTDVRHTLSPHLFLTLGFLMLLFYVNIFWLFKKSLRYKNVLLRIILPVVWFVVLYLANSYSDTLLMVPNNGQTLLHSFELEQRRDVFGPPPIMKNDFVGQTRAVFFAGNGLSNTVLFIFIIVFGLSIAYFFLKEWAKADLSRNQMQAVQLNTEIKFLKSQINPHFLFNTLNNLFSMAQDKGNDELADGISKLSGMMRYMIYESNAGEVPLADEIAYLNNCIALNKLRYADDEAAVTFNYPDQVQNVLIAPMLFIPFIENAFKHGVLINQRSKIDIDIAVSGKEVIFNCENKNYSFVKKMDDKTSGIGLENVKRRLELVYPGKHELTIKNDADKYFVVLKINLE